MIKCSQCGYENPDDEVLCIRCGLVLKREDLVRNGSTYRLEKPDNLTISPRWGTARLGAERQLVLHLRDQDRPLVVEITDSLILGRHDADTGEVPDIDLEPYNAQDQGVSRRHAMITVEDDGLKIVDLGSANSTFLNGQKLIAHQARILRDGDELRLGRFVIRVNFA